MGGGGGFALSTIGCFIHLAATPGQTIPSGGASLEFNNFETLQHNNWDTQLPTFPADEVGIPLRRYYDILVAFRWATWDNGGTVVIERVTGGVPSPVWPPISDSLVGRWSTDANGTPTFIGIAKGILLEVADTIRVSVDSGDSGDQDILGGYMTIEAVEEAGPTIGQDLFIFLEDGTFDWELAGRPTTLRDVWIIGGGGGAPGNSVATSWKPSGAGAGGRVHLTDWPVSGDIAVTVGLGGTGTIDGTATGGGDSEFDGEIAPGGAGGGVGTTQANGDNGGCGAGGSTAGAVTSGTGGTGSHGGDGGDASAANNAGGGGGGVDGDGQDGQSGGNGGDGGPGIDLSAIVGVGYGDNGWFGGGGAGSGPTTGGTGGQGGGGDGAAPGESGGDAIQNSGGGGGGGWGAGGSGGRGGHGADGIVIVRVR